MDETLCTKCGACCYFKADGKQRKCKYLVVLGTKTHCRIYKEKTRLGRIIFTMKDGTKVRCSGRLASNRIVNGCPYNDLVIAKMKKEGILNEKVLTDEIPQ